MYKILARSLKIPEKSLANFTSMYRRVAINHLSRLSSTTVQTKKSVPRNHTEDGEGSSSKSKIRPTFRTKSSSSVSNGKGFLKRSWFSEAKETVHIMMFSTSSSKYFYASTLNQAKQSPISQKYFRNQKTLDLYKQALEQCMKIKFERHRIQKRTRNVAWTPEPFKANHVKETIALARTKNAETLPSEDKPKKIVRLHPKKTMSVESMKQLVKQKRTLQYVKKKKFQIVYPTHMIKYKLGLQKPYQVENSMAKKLRPVVSTAEPEVGSVKSVFKREINTVEVMPPKNKQNNDLLAVMMASQKRREKEVVPEVDETIKHLISQHPSMKKVTERAKMSINKKYNIILLKSQAKIKLQMKPKEVTADTSEKLDLSTIQPEQNEPSTQFEQAESEKSHIEKKLEADVNIVQHPISTNLDQPDLKLNFKYPKRLFSEKNETFDIDEICLKTKESYVVYTDEISDAINKIQGKKEIETMKQKATEEDKNIVTKKENVSDDKSVVEQRLRKLLMRNEKQVQSASVSNQNLGTPAQSLIDYLKKLNDLKDQTSMERSTIKKPFLKTIEKQKVEVNKVNITEDKGGIDNGVDNEITKQQGISKAGLKEEENRERNLISNLNNIKSLQEKLLERKVAQELIGKNNILTMNKEETVEDVVRETVMQRIKALSLSQNADTRIRKTTSKYLLENMKPNQNTDHQTEEVPLKKADEAKETRRNQQFQKILNQYIVKPIHKEHEFGALKNEETSDKSKPRYPDQKNLMPVEDINEGIPREEYSPHNREKLKSISKYANQRLEQKTFRSDADTFKVASEGHTKTESDRINDKPAEEISSVTLKDSLYKDKLKNLLEPANQYFGKLREVGGNQIRSLGALKDQFKTQISENISKGLNIKNMLENTPKLVENDKKSPTIVENLGKQSKLEKDEKPSSSQDCLLLIKKSTREDEDYDVIQIELDSKKLKAEDGADGKLQTSNIENNKQNTLPNNRPTIRQERPPQRPPTKNINDKKDKKDKSRPHDSQKLSSKRLNKEETRPNKENTAGPSGHQNRFENLESKHEKHDAFFGDSRIVMQDNIMKSKCAQELEDLENIIHKHKPRRRDCLDAAFIPEKFPNQQFFRNWLSTLNSIEELEIAYKDGSDSTLIWLAEEVDNIVKNLNTHKSPSGKSRVEFDPFKRVSNYQTIGEDTILGKKENDGHYIKVHPNLLNLEKPDAKIPREENSSYNNDKLKLIPESTKENPVQKTFESNEGKLSRIVKQEPVKKNTISQDNEPENFNSKEKLEDNKNVNSGETKLNSKNSVATTAQKSGDQGMIAHLETSKPENISHATSRKLEQQVIVEGRENKIDTPPAKMMNYAYSSEKMGVNKIEHKIEDKAILSQQIVMKNSRKNTISAITQKEELEKEPSQGKVWTEINSRTKQAKADIKSTPSKPNNSFVNISNTSSMRYSGPKLSMEKEKKQTSKPKWPSNLSEKSEQRKPTFGHKSTSNLLKKVTPNEENKSIAPKKVERFDIRNPNIEHGLKHQSQNGTESKKKGAQGANGDSENRSRGKSESRLMRMYLLDEHEGYDEFIAGLQGIIKQPIISIENVEMKKPTVKPVWKENFKSTHVMNLSRKKSSTDPKKDSKGVNLDKEAGFRRKDISDEMKKGIPRFEPQGNVNSVNENEKMILVQEEKKIKPQRKFVANSKIYSSYEGTLKDNSEKSIEDRNKIKTTKSPEEQMAVQKRENFRPLQESVAESKLDTTQNDKLENHSKKSNEDIERTKSIKSLEELNKITTSPDPFKEYLMRAKENRDNKAKSPQKKLKQNDELKDISKKRNENMEETESTKSLEELQKTTSSPNCFSAYSKKAKENRDTKSPIHKHSSQNKHKEEAITKLEKEKSKPIQESVTKSEMGLVFPMHNDKLKDNSNKCNEDMIKAKTTKSLEELNKETSSPDCSSHYSNKAKETQNIKTKHEEKPMIMQEKQLSKHPQESIAESKVGASLQDSSKKSMEKTKPMKSPEALSKSTSAPDCSSNCFKIAKKSRKPEAIFPFDEHSSQGKHIEQPRRPQETVAGFKKEEMSTSREGKSKDNIFKQSNEKSKTKSLEELNKITTASDGFSGSLKKIDECDETIFKLVAHKKTSNVKYGGKNDTDLSDQSKSTGETICENKSDANDDKALKTKENSGISKVKRLSEKNIIGTIILKKADDKPETKISTPNSVKKSSKSVETENKTKSREKSQNMTNASSYLVSNRSSPNPARKSETRNESSKKINGESSGKKSRNVEDTRVAVHIPEEKKNELIKTGYIEESITKKNEYNLKKSSNISENESKSSSPTILEAVPAKDLAEGNKRKPEATKENPKDKSTGPGKKQKVIIRLSRHPNVPIPTKPTSKKNNYVPNTKSKEESSKNQAKIKEILSIEPKTVLDYIIDNQLKKRNVEPERMLEEAKILKQKYHNERLHKVMDKYRADIDKIENSYNQKIAPADEELHRQRKYKENELEAFRKKIEEEIVKKEVPKKVEHEANLNRERVHSANISTKDSSSYANDKMKANCQSHLLNNNATKIKLIARAKSSKYLLENQVNHMRRIKTTRKQKNECYLMEKIGTEKTNTFKSIFKVSREGDKKIETISKKVDEDNSNNYLFEKQLPAELISSNSEANRIFTTENEKGECKPTTSKYLLENKTLVSTGKLKTDGNKSPNSPKGSKELHSDAAIKTSGTIKAVVSKILPTLTIIENQSQFGKMIIDTDLSSIFPEMPQKNEGRKDMAEIKEIFHQREKLLKFNKKLADHMLTQSPENKLKNKSVDSGLNKFLVTDIEKKEGFKKCLSDFDQSIQKEIKEEDQQKKFLGTIVLRKIVDGPEKPKAKLTMEKELPKYPPEKKKTDNKKFVTKSCDKLCVPPKTISQACYSQPRDDITTLTKCSNDRIVSIPKQKEKKFNIYEKYKGLKISFITVKRTEKKKGEHFLPALSSLEGEKNINESTQNLETKAKILAFRREFLKKLKEEFEFLDKNQNNFPKVREHYERVLRESTENNDNKSVFKFPMIQERPKKKEGDTDNTVSDDILSLNPDHVPKNCTKSLIKKLTDKEVNDNKGSETPEKPKVDPKK